MTAGAVARPRAGEAGARSAGSGRLRPLWGALRPYWILGALAVFVAIFLYVDDRMNSLPVQRGLGVLTFTILILCGVALEPEERRQICVLVLFATCLELFSSQLWGVYRYRFGNVPLYIPPGHGIVFVMCALITRTPVVRAHPAAFRRMALGISAGWALAAVSILPPITHRLDMEGALLWPIFALFVLASRRYSTFFAAVFFVTAAVELFGVACGDWAWNPVAPYLRIPGGNPPSVIAGAYSCLEASAVVALTILLRGSAHPTALRDSAPPSATRPAEAA